MTVRFRPLGGAEWGAFPAVHHARAVWQATFPAAAGDFEYFVEAQAAGSRPLRWPATAPAMNQTLVVLE
jgi:hypothetical protein